MPQVWKTFYFEGNQIWGDIDSPEKWREVLREYKKVGYDLTMLRRCKENPDTKRGMPAFGYYSEYKGPRTLGEWADAEEIDLNLEPAD